MKKILLLSIAAGISVSSFAQTASISTGITQTTSATSKSLHKTTSVVRDSLLLSNLHASDSLKLYYAGSGPVFDSGYFGGTNGYGFTAFAERYDFNGADSSIEILGVFSLFDGTVNPASTKTVTFKAWNVGAVETTSRPTLSFSGFPGTVVDSVNAPITSLGITDTSYSYTAHYFATPAPYRTTSFFVGYSINYSYTALAGDTIGVFTSKNGQRTSNIYNISGGDTTVNDVNTTMQAGTWFDNGYNFGVKSNFVLLPIVDTKNSLAVHGITKNNLTFFGNYPNPATDATNIKFSLAQSTDVAITITDMNGRTIKTINNTALSAGEHIVPVTTSDLAAGNYIYVVHTASGDGIASTLTVIK